MIGFDQQLSFANAMAKNFAEAATTVFQAQASLWGVPNEPQPGKSWYRPPAANPFDWSAWTLTPTTFVLPWTVMGPYSSPMSAMPAASAYADFLGMKFQPWTALANFASAMAMFEPAQGCWNGISSRAAEKEARAFAWQAILWPASQIDAFASGAANSVETPAEFARHRSTGGHAAVAIRLMPDDGTPVSDHVH